MTEYEKDLAFDRLIQEYDLRDRELDEQMRILSKEKRKLEERESEVFRFRRDLDELCSRLAETAGEGESAFFFYANEQAATARLRTEEQFREEQERLDAEMTRLRMQKEDVYEGKMRKLRQMEEDPAQ